MRVVVLGLASLASAIPSICWSAGTVTVVDRQPDAALNQFCQCRADFSELLRRGQP
jgi:hypothetical protein